MFVVDGYNDQYVVRFYGKRGGKLFDCWSSKPMTLSRAWKLRVRLERVSGGRRDH